MTEEKRTSQVLKKAAKFDRPIERITKTKLVNLLLEQEARGANFVQVFSRTEPSMRKTDNPFYGKVCKVSEKNAQIGWFYENAVQNQRTREENFDTFTPEPRKWGSFVENPFIGRMSKTVLEHTNKKKEYCQYVQMRTLSTVKTSYEWLETGEELSDTETEELKTFFPPYRQAKTQGTEKPIVINDYKIQSIEMLSMNNVLYVVVGS